MMHGDLSIHIPINPLTEYVNIYIFKYLNNADMSTYSVKGLTEVWIKRSRTSY